jgi:hypothetical protein
VKMPIFQRLVTATGLVALMAACNASGSADMAARLDPTGISGTVVGTARDLRPNTEDADAPREFNLGLMAPRLDAVAAGDLSRPNMAAAADSQINQAMTMQTLNLAASVANAGIGAAMSGGASLAAAAPGLAMRAAGTGYAMAKMGEAKTRIRDATAGAEAERTAARVVPDEDRPAEARAILSVVAGTGRSASWQNPASGASGKVTVKALNGPQLPSGMRCRMIAQEWRGTGGSRSGHMMACAHHGVWYDLS